MNVIDRCVHIIFCVLYFIFLNKIVKARDEMKTSAQVMTQTIFRNRKVNNFILQKKRRKELKRGDENATNGLSFDDDDDDDKLRDMARRFEAKYVCET